MGEGIAVVDVVGVAVVALGLGYELGRLVTRRAERERAHQAACAWVASVLATAEQAARDEQPK